MQSSNVAYRALFIQFVSDRFIAPDLSFYIRLTLIGISCVRVAVAKPGWTCAKSVKNLGRAYNQQPIGQSSMLGQVNALSTSVPSFSLKSLSPSNLLFSIGEHLSGEHHVSFE